MRGARAKYIRRHIYGKGMPRHHLYEKIKEHIVKVVDKDKKELFRYIAFTVCAINGRRAYQAAKKKFKAGKKSLT